MTLEELKQTAAECEEDTIYTIEDIYSIIQSIYSAGGTICTFRNGSSNWADEISERQVDQLRADGYTVTWNRACLWYEVSGW